MKINSKHYIMVAVVLLICIPFAWRITQNRQAHSRLEQQKITAAALVRANWNHYKNNNHFDSDWWSGKFSPPKMIQDNGRPLAFTDDLDLDLDGLKGINWSNPTQPFEYITVSETSAYVMLRAVWMNDRPTFDKVWRWTYNNLMRKNIRNVYYWKDLSHPENAWKTTRDLKLEADSLFAWRWVPSLPGQPTADAETGGVIYYRWQPPMGSHDPNTPWRDGWDTAADADIDIALALIFAHSLWGSMATENANNYAEIAKDVLNDIWNKETFVAGSRRYLSGGNKLKSIEPGYLSPFSFRIFNEFDPDHDWLTLVDSAYRIFRDAGRFPMNPIYKDGVTWNNTPDLRHDRPAPNLLPDWINVNPDGSLANGSPRNEPEFGSDAFRGLWRIAVDYMWNHNPEALDILDASRDTSPLRFFQWRMKHPPKGYGPKDPYDLTGKLSSVFWHDGEVARKETNYDYDTGYLANAGNYGVYLDLFYAAGQYRDALSFLTPLITPEQNGVSKRQYIIPDDQLAHESSADLKRNTPIKLRNQDHDKGLPYSEQDGWYCTSKWGGYWTIYDQSDWNSQNEYFNTTWTWFGLAAFSGIAKNLYPDKNIPPTPIRSIDLFGDAQCQQAMPTTIDRQQVMVRVNAQDRDPRHRNFLYINVRPLEHATAEDDVRLKLSETTPTSGIFTGWMNLGLQSDPADRMVKGIIHSTIQIKAPGFRGKSIERTIGDFYISKPIENFTDGQLYDADPASWWTDAIDPGADTAPVSTANKGIYIWKDRHEFWHLTFSPQQTNDNFSGDIAAESSLQLINKPQLNPASKIVLGPRAVNFSITPTRNTTEFIFKLTGPTVRFNLKYNHHIVLNNVFIGQQQLHPNTIPFSLNTQGLTGTYQLTVADDVTTGSATSLKCYKHYAGKDYPYFGAVLFNPAVMDWSQTDEFAMDLYLYHDVGTIRMDIQNQNGTIGILNGYSPWKAENGPGWYTWKSSTPRGMEADRQNIDPRPIRDRAFWKAWNFDANKNLPASTNFNLRQINNIQFCVGPGLDANETLYLANLRLMTHNYYKGQTPPSRVKKIKFFLDPQYSRKLASKTVTQNLIYVEVVGCDGDPQARDTFEATVLTTDPHKDCTSITLPLEETGADTGIYRAKLTIGLSSDQKSQMIGAAKKQKITLRMPGFFAKKRSVKVGHFPLHLELDNFDASLENRPPSTWWTDELDPLRGVPQYTPGTDLGYYIWKSDMDNTWHLRWSADAANHLFQGSIYTDGKIENVHRINMEPSDNYTLKKNNKIVLNAQEKSGEDGVDFSATGKDIRFDLMIDQHHQSDKVQIGSLSYAKAYAMPLILKNDLITQTYVLKTLSAIDPHHAQIMQVQKKYNSKLYPYFGKWGLDNQQADWSKSDGIRFNVYLDRDPGNIRMDIEDTSGNRALLNEYNPWNEQKGPGWYTWDSGYANSPAVYSGRVQPRSIQERTWWKGWDIANQRTIDLSGRINLSHIINLLFCVGGGNRDDVTFNMDNLTLYTYNDHTGITLPKRTQRIELFTSANYRDGKLAPGTEIPTNKLYIQLRAKDRNPWVKDRIPIRILSDAQIEPATITVNLTETDTHSGRYRGSFLIDLSSDREQDQIGAPRGSHITLIASDGVQRREQIGQMINTYTLDDFENGNIASDYPLTWWVDSILPYVTNLKKLKIDPVFDKGFFIYKDLHETWHFIWNPLRDMDILDGYIKVEDQPTLLGHNDFSGIHFDPKSEKILITDTGNEDRIKQFTFKTTGKTIKLYLTVNGHEVRKQIFIGEQRKTPYILPIEIGNTLSTSNYTLSLETKTPYQGKFALRVDKVITEKLYPFFGAWGLRKDMSEFSNKDQLKFMIYLPEDPESVRVDIEDINGVSAVLNGYNPYDKNKGPGWYEWRSDYTPSDLEQKGLIQALPIGERQWWKGWSIPDQQYVDVSSSIDLHKIKTIQFSIGGGNHLPIRVLLDNITLTKPNYLIAKHLPLRLNDLAFYKDAQFLHPLQTNEPITQPDIYVKAVGQDANPFTRDSFKVKLYSDDPRPDASSINIQLRETSTFSGNYIGKFNLGLYTDQTTNTLGIERGRHLFLRLLNQCLVQPVGTIITKLLIDDFADNNINNIAPVIWWTDTLLPFITEPTYKTEDRIDEQSESGYYIWKTDRWHFRWYSKQKEETFSGSLSGLKGATLTLTGFAPMSFNQVKTQPQPTGRTFTFHAPNHRFQVKELGKSIEFNASAKKGWQGFDFQLNGDLMDIDLIQNGIHDSRQIWVGQSRTPTYIVPFRLHNSRLLKTYRLASVPNPIQHDGYELQVVKKNEEKPYPYFGFWGLFSEKSHWNRLNELYFWIYLPSDIGEIKVEARDTQGYQGVINGYDPYIPRRIKKEDLRLMAHLTTFQRDLVWQALIKAKLILPETVNTAIVQETSQMPNIDLPAILSSARVSDNQIAKIDLLMYRIYKAGGPRWYKWSSNVPGTPEDIQGNADIRPFNNRLFWSSWDERAQSVIDTTELFDTANVRNVQILLGSGRYEDVTVNIKDVYLLAKNYRVGNAYPQPVTDVALYRDNLYSDRIPSGSVIDLNKMYLQIKGKDSNPNAVDEIQVFVGLKGKPLESFPITLLESTADSGIYQNYLLLSPTPVKLETPVRLAERGDILEIKTLGSIPVTRQYPVGEIPPFGSGPQQHSNLRLRGLIIGLLVILSIALAGYRFRLKRRNESNRG